MGSLVNRLLARFVVSAEGESGSALRVSLSSGGSVVLHRLELNLDPLLGRLPVRVKRAYAGQLQISVPWTALATQPIQVRCLRCLSPSTSHCADGALRGDGCCRRIDTRTRCYFSSIILFDLEHRPNAACMWIWQNVPTHNWRTCGP